MKNKHKIIHIGNEHKLINYSKTKNAFHVLFISSKFSHVYNNNQLVFWCQIRVKNISNFFYNSAFLPFWDKAPVIKRPKQVMLDLEI